MSKYEFELDDMQVDRLRTLGTVLAGSGSRGEVALLNIEKQVIKAIIAQLPPEPEPLEDGVYSYTSPTTNITQLFFVKDNKYSRALGSSSVEDWYSLDSETYEGNWQRVGALPQCSECRATGIHKMDCSNGG